MANMVAAVELGPRGLCQRQAAIGLSVPSYASLSPWGSSKCSAGLWDKHCISFVGCDRPALVREDGYFCSQGTISMVTVLAHPS